MNKSIDREHILIGICTPCFGPAVYKEWVHYLNRMERPYPYVHFFMNHPNLPTARNDLVDMALKEGCTHILWLDADIEMPSKGIERLISYDKELIGYICYRKYYPYEPNIYKNGKVLTKFKKGLIEVDAIGTGCLMVKIEVFEKIKDTEGYNAMRGTYFRFQEDRIVKRKVLGEDLTFCLLARNAGYKIYADTKSPCIHWGAYGYSEKDFIANQKK